MGGKTTPPAEPLLSPGRDKSTGIILDEYVHKKKNVALSNLNIRKQDGIRTGFHIFLQILIYDIQGHEKDFTACERRIRSRASQRDVAHLG